MLSGLEESSFGGASSMSVSKDSVAEAEARVIAPTPCRMEEEVAPGAATGEVGADMVEEVKG
jgi:hypothetical protein